LSVPQLHDLRALVRRARDRSRGVIVAAAQRDCDKRDRKAARPPQLAFAGSSNDFSLVRILFHDTSMR
jgi:hypothetical protein